MLIQCPGKNQEQSQECEAPADISEDGIQYVLDGGALLQRIP